MKNYFAYKNMNKSQLPQQASAVIERYKNLRIGGEKTVRCPYYRNPTSGKERWGLNAFSGKGSPWEIEQELRIIAKLENKDFSVMNEEQVRDIMKKRRLGVECSGFLAHVFDAWTQAVKGKRLYAVLAFPSRTPWGKIAAYLRPFTHIDIDMLTRPQNAVAFSDAEELRAGDIIRFNTEIDHAILVTAVERENPLGPALIRYAHSVREETGEGVKDGIIYAENFSMPLTEQKWEEIPDTGQTIRERGIPLLYHPLFL